MNKLKLLAVLPLAAGTLALGAQAANAAASASLSPSSGPIGTKVTVTGSGFKPNTALVALQCKSTNASSASDCDTATVDMSVQSDASGKVNFPFTIQKSSTTCTTATNCVIAISSTNTADTADRAGAVFTLTTGSSSSSSAPSGGSASSSSGTGAGSTTTDPGVNAGTGGTADREGMPAGVIALAAIGAVAVAGGAVRFARR